MAHEIALEYTPTPNQKYFIMIMPVRLNPIPWHPVSLPKKPHHDPGSITGRQRDEWDEADGFGFHEWGGSGAARNNASRTLN